MFSYKYNDEYIIIEKSAIPLVGDKVCFSDHDFDIQLYDVTVGLIDQNKYITLYTSHAKPSEVLAKNLIIMEINRAAAELDLDFRLSLIELNIN